MEHIIIGDDLLKEVANTIQESGSFSVLLTSWQSFGNELGVKDEVILDLQLKYNLGNLELNCIPRELLKTWAAKKSIKATLMALYNALKKCGLLTIADSLKNKFCNANYGLTKIPMFMLQGRLLTLEKLFEGSKISEKFIQSICDELKNYLSAEPIRLTKTEVHPTEKPKYYIQRTFLHRTELEEKIFKDYSTKNHVFLVKGIKQSDLARVCDYKLIERSGKQLKKVTVQFMLLESDDDFDKVSHNTKAPVHMIEYKNKAFFLLKSSDGMDKIQQFLKNEGIPIQEEEAVKKINTIHSPSALSIAASPGMGKSFVLANLSSEVMKTNPNAVVIFISLQEFLRKIHSSSQNISILNEILKYAASNDIAKFILQEMVRIGSFQFYFFFDGYDEVLQDKAEFVNMILKELKGIPKITIVTTTRFHEKSNLENIFGRLSFEILRFDESNQIEFLTKYWISEHGAVGNDQLKNFAKQCLQALEMKMTDNEKNIAGIPLQCFMLAEVYAEQATRASKLEELSEDFFQISSFFELYKSLMERKFKRISDFGNPLELRQTYVDAHVHDSLELLFPNWLNRFKHLLIPREEAKECVMYSIGLIEKSPFSKSKKFLHRTFAENIIAEFIVHNLSKDVTVLEFLISNILQKMVERNIWHCTPKQYNLSHPVIAYFVDMYLQDHLENNDLDTFAFLNFFDLKNIPITDICTAANSCCYNNLENCFDLIVKILHKLGPQSWINVYFKDLPFVVVENTDNLSLLKKVLEFTRLELGVSLSFHVPDEPDPFEYEEPEVQRQTPLHLAVYKGNYNLVMYLMEEYGDDVRTFKGLINSCLHESANNTESVIENKLSIIELLAKLNPNWLKRCGEFKAPIFENYAHLKLIQKLVELGADINEEDNGTILHHWKDGKTFPSLLKWALKSGFNQINTKIWLSEAPLLAVFMIFKTLDDDILRSFYDAGADFNAILFYTIEFTESDRVVNFVEKVLNFGGNPTYIDCHGRNACHLIIEYYEDKPILALKLLKLLESKGLKGLHQKNRYGTTPVQYALTCEILDDDDVLKYFMDAGPDESGNSILLLALKFSKNLATIRKILEFGANPTHTNFRGENPAHFVMKHFECDLKAMQFIEIAGQNKINYESFESDERLDQCCSFMDGFNPFQFRDDDGYCLRPFVYWHLKDIDNGDTSDEDFSDYECDNIQNLEFLPDCSLHFEMLELLESYGFNGFNLKDQSGITPFRKALDLGLADLQGFLRICKADPDKDGDTVLFHAIRYQMNVDFIRKMLDFGAVLKHQNNHGENVAHMITKYYRDKSVMQLFKLFQSMEFQGFDQKDNDGRTPLMNALMKGAIDDEILQFFCEVGADFNARDNDGDSVLFHAVWYSKNPDCVKSILDFKANLNIANNFGESAAHCVLKNRHYQDNPKLALDMLKLLEMRGFKGYDGKDQDANTPLMIAKKWNIKDEELLRYLQERNHRCSIQ